MGKEVKYYFTFYNNHHPVTNERTDGYWVEVIVPETLVISGNKVSSHHAIAKNCMNERYGRNGWHKQYKEKEFKPELYFKGCLEKLYLPLPEDIDERYILWKEPFLNKPAHVPYFPYKHETKLEKILSDKNIRLIQVCRDTGISYPTIMSLARNPNPSSLKDEPAVRTLADYLKVKIEDILY